MIPIGFLMNALRPGKSALDLYREQSGNPNATAEDMFNALKGAPGAPGSPGTPGSPGAAGPSALVPLPNITIAQTAAVAIAAGVRTVRIAGITGLLANDLVLLSPQASGGNSTLPAGYAIHSAVAVANGTLEVSLTAPLLAIGASYSIVCKLAAVR